MTLTLSVCAPIVRSLLQTADTNKEELELQQKLKWKKFVEEHELQQQRERNAGRLVQKDADMVKYINRFGMVSSPCLPPSLSFSLLLWVFLTVCACMVSMPTCLCVCACVRVCVRACVCVFMSVYACGCEYAHACWCM